MVRDKCIGGARVLNKLLRHITSTDHAAEGNLVEIFPVAKNPNIPLYPKVCLNLIHGLLFEIEGLKVYRNEIIILDDISVEHLNSQIEISNKNAFIFTSRKIGNKKSLYLHILEKCSTSAVSLTVAELKLLGEYGTKYQEVKRELGKNRKNDGASKQNEDERAKQNGSPKKNIGDRLILSKRISPRNITAKKDHSPTKPPPIKRSTTQSLHGKKKNRAVAKSNQRIGNLGMNHNRAVAKSHQRIGNGEMLISNTNFQAISTKQVRTRERAADALKAKNDNLEAKILQLQSSLEKMQDLRHYS